MHTANPSRCAHRQYQMSCVELDDLLARAANRCQVCGTEAASTAHGTLHIDHDAAIGEWAVRGLLCSYCNTQLDSNRERLDRAAVASYLATPWYRLMLQERGLPLGVPSEPPIGSGVALPQGTVMRRSEAGWRWDSWPHGVRISHWVGLYRKFGPHNLLPVELDPEIRDPEILAIVTEYDRDVERATRKRDVAIARALASGRAPSEVARLSTYSRETVRQIARATPEFACGSLREQE